jgi:hypothetical protein
MSRTARLSLLALVLLSPIAGLHAQTGSTAELKISGGSTPLTITVADLKKMPRKTLSVVNPHNKKTEVYDGVLVEELLHRAGVAHGENLRGKAMAT